MTELLKLSSIHSGYGQSVVLQDLSLEVREGEVVCLIGANGAGKTTTTRVLTGLLKQWSGQVIFAGENLDKLPPHARVERGICLSPEGRQVFPAMTVRENLLLGAYSKRSRPSRERQLEFVYGLFPILTQRSNQRAGLMSGGEQTMLAIGRALMGCPKLLVLDEPSLGLAPKLVLHVYRALSKIAGQGISVLFVEQNVRAALSLAHRGYVLANGQIAVAGTSAELKASPMVQEAFLAKKRPAADAAAV